MFSCWEQNTVCLPKYCQSHFLTWYTNHHFFKNPLVSYMGPGVPEFTQMPLPLLLTYVFCFYELVCCTNVLKFKPYKHTPVVIFFRCVCPAGSTYMGNIKMVPYILPVSQSMRLLWSNSGRNASRIVVNVQWLWQRLWTGFLSFGKF